MRIGLRRYRAAYNTNKWIDAVSGLMKQYNNTVCRVTGQKPKDVLTKPLMIWRAYEKLYLPDRSAAKKKPRKPRSEYRESRLPKINDFVRVSRLKGDFEKESTEKGLFSREIFKVVGVNRSQKVPMFRLEDLRKGRNAKSKLVDGGFYPWELQIVPYEPKELFEVEKIIGRKVLRGVRMVKVKWKGYNQRGFSSWLPESDLQQVDSDQLKSHVK